MEPRIQYAKTSDGVRIAYYLIGEGPPLVHIRLMFSHLTAELGVGLRIEPLLEDASRSATIVRYDHRGFGLSDRTAADFSLDALCLDLEAVVARLGLRRFYITTDIPYACFVAINYAALHPEQVWRMALWRATTQIPPGWHDQVTRLFATFPNDWRSVTESITRYAGGWDADAPARTAAALLRASVDMPGFEGIWREMARWDVSPVLPSVNTPALLLYQRGSATHRAEMYGPEHGRELASVMPNASVMVTEDVDSRYRAIRSFFGAPEVRAEARPEPELPSGTAIILFLDIAGSTELTTKLGDAAYRDKERQLDASLRQAIRDAGGSPVEGKVLGDGVMATFASAKDAIEAAMKCQALGEGAGVPLHAGIHAGDVTREGNNVHGGAVQVAARIADASTPGDVLVSDIVRGLARTSAGVSFEDRGEHELKGVGEPQRLWAVVGQAQSA